MNRDEQLALLWLTEKAGASVIDKVIAKAGESSFFDIDKTEWMALGITEKQAERLSDKKGFAGLEKRLDRMLSMGIRILNRNSNEYPYTVECSDKLPPILFVKSKNKCFFKDGVGVVGSRKATAYGLEVARYIGREAALRGIPTISGAALGIDTAAHNGSLDAKGPTVAVLGSGMFHVYPKSAGPLLEKISENGMVISQFAPNVPPDKKTFPIRNAIIAALSSSVVVVEGTANSGARHTANYAKKYERKIFAVPGEISRPQAVLPNRLIKEGARILLNPADPVDVLMEKSGQVALDFKQSKKSSLKTDLTDKLEPIQKKLLKQIQNVSGSIDDILTAEIAGASVINQHLLELELKGFIKQEGGRNYVCLLND